MIQPEMPKLTDEQERRMSLAINIVGSETWKDLKEYTEMELSILIKKMMGGDQSEIDRLQIPEHVP